MQHKPEPLVILIGRGEHQVTTSDTTGGATGKCSDGISDEIEQRIGEYRVPKLVYNLLVNMQRI